MDFKKMLESLSVISEATKETEKGKIHTADAGGYGRKFDTDEEGDEKKAAKAEAPKRGRGRPKKDADEAGEVKKYDSSALSKAFGGGQKPKKEVGKTSVKHSLKEYFDQLDQALNEGETIEKKGGRVHKGTYGTSYDGDEKPAAPAAPRGRGRPKKGADDSGEVKKFDTKGMQDYIVGNKPKTLPGKASVKHKIKEADQVTIAPAQQNTQVIKQGQKTLGTVTNPQLAQQIKQSIGKGEMTLAGSELNEKDEGKPGKNFAKIAKSAGERYGSKAAGERVAGAVRAKLAKQGKLEEGSKPDYIDLDKDGDKKETMKKAAKDKKKVSESIKLQESPGTLEHIINKYKHEVKNFLAGGDLDSDLYEALFDYYLDAGEIPYGIAKARSGDPFEWVTQRFDADVHDHVVDETFVPTKVNPVNIPAVQRKQMGAAPLSVKDVTRADPTTRSGSENLALLNKGQKPEPFGLNMKEDPFAFEGTEMKDIQFEGWEQQLNTLLTEGITVSSSTGQQGAPDSVTVSATDADADQLLQVLRQAGVGVFGGGDQAHSGYGAPVSDVDPEGNGTEPEVSPDVVDDGDDMLALIKKMTGISDAGEAGADDYEQEGGEETSLQPADGEESEEGSEDEAEQGSEEDSEEAGEEEQTDEGNAFGAAVAKAKSDGIQQGEKVNVGGKSYPVKEEEYCDACDSAECHCDEEQVEESFANSAEDPAETELYKLKALLSMGNDLNRAKRNQTTLPHTEVTTTESLNDWKKLSGIR